MKEKLKQAAGLFALSAMALGAIAPPAFAVETGQLLDRGRFPRYITLERGSAECPGPACTPEVINEGQKSGQITPKEAKVLRKIQSNPPSVARNKSATIDPPPPTASEVETGQLLIKDRPVAKAVDTTATGNDLCGLTYTPPCSSTERGKSGTIKTDPNIAARNKTGWIILSVSALAVAGGVLAATSGDDKPASPS
jgi:hypothetical protein